ncbi:voltage-dependent L-type calcium channel subunit [Senna tora]|uniref:Voltage-dependent L-type calcium channel subunit n=1 Tax=Senna tora TaxID=362788 RepID=A0A834WPG7_9FABA|nr:voltage-dependent L-type calcium channel subunit [Senna tora]
MAESYETEKPKPNGVYVDVSGDHKEGDGNFQKKGRYGMTERDSLYEVLHRMIGAILVAEQGNSGPLLHRIRTSVSQYAPLIPEASRNTGQDVILWTRRGSPLRALLVISVGTITLVSLTGLFVFMLFLLAATVNAIVISLLVSLAVAGGFLAFFFASVTAIYIGALSIAIFAICTVTFWATVAILITTGWIGFFCAVWLATKKSYGIAKDSLSATGAAISSYADARHPLKIENLDRDLKG